MVGTLFSFFLGFGTTLLFNSIVFISFSMFNLVIGLASWVDGRMALLDVDFLGNNVDADDGAIS